MPSPSPPPPLFFKEIIECLKQEENLYRSQVHGDIRSKCISILPLSCKGLFARLYFGGTKINTY